jgi:hypothetical protein
MAQRFLFITLFIVKLSCLEECSFILRCAQPFANLNSSNVIISELLCAPEGLNSRLGLFVRWNASWPIHQSKSFNNAHPQKHEPSCKNFLTVQLFAKNDE